ncbi:hypothetical protein ABI59_10715 [Acidobacteria bacterium Mor1]|nr:hypothetical protein ABI59_10715 [Acidobacteria bacterium Mor1]
MAQGRASTRLRASLLLAAGIFLACISGAPRAADPVVVGSKNFAESRLLAEMFARLIEEHAGLEVERRFDLAGTTVCFDGLRSGAIDLYPEYTGTGLVTLLGQPVEGGPSQTLRTVRREFLDRWQLQWLAPLGFENAYELAVPRELAERHGLRTISDLVGVAGELRAGLGYEFLEREDGLPGLEKVYGLRFAEQRGMQQALKYRAAAAREIDCLDVYTTDGRLLVHDLQVLEDDRGFFPPYQAAPLVRRELLEEQPGVAGALALLSGAFDEDAMRALNLRMQEQGEPAEQVAQDALEELGLVGEREIAAVATEGRSWWSYLWATRAEIGRRTLEHLGLTALPLLLGILFAVPLAMWLARVDARAAAGSARGSRFAEQVIRLIAVTQTIPSIALLAFMLPLLGVGWKPAVAALWIYSLFPILRNTFTGLRDAGPAAVAAATALGMTESQVLRHVRLPLAAPVIMAGVRTSAVLLVGTAVLAAFIGAGGLGVPIVSGLQLADNTRVLSGAVPAALLAVLVDGILAAVERGIRPRGLQK